MTAFQADGVRLESLTYVLPASEKIPVQAARKDE
jgi:hypothetical protein